MGGPAAVAIAAREGTTQRDLRNMGFHPLQIGLIIVMVLNIGLCTPPLGTVLFTAQSVSAIPVEEILRDLRPFLLAQVMVVAVLVFVPQTVLWLPALLGFTV